MESMLEQTPDSAWVFTAEGFDPLREAIYESRFSISNGFLGLRAGRAVSRGERWVVPHRAYVAGVFDIPGPEHPIPALVPAPGWQQIRITLHVGPLVHHPAHCQIGWGGARSPPFCRVDRQAKTENPCDLAAPLSIISSGPRALN